jgi:glucokinase
MKYIFAIDLGATKTAIGLLNQRVKILRKEVISTKSSRTASGWLRRVTKILLSFFNEYQIKERDVSALTVAVAGVIDRERGCLVKMPNLPNWPLVPLKKYWRRYFSFPIILENDANVAALAEWRYGAAYGSKNMIYLTVSTGIGGGIIVNNHLYKGLGSAGEIGHMIISSESNYQCGCGNFGCFETLASGTAIARMAKEQIAKNKKSLILTLANHRIKNITAKIVYLASRQNDVLAKKIVRESQKWLAVGLVNIIHIFHPEIIVLGGGVMRDADLILPTVKKMVSKMIIPAFKDVKIKKSAFGEDVSLVGGLVLKDLEL